MLLGALLLVCRSSESQQGWSGTKPVLVATGSAPPAELCEFPSSLNRFGNSSSLLLIAQGNTDAEMPHVRAPGSTASALGHPRRSPATPLRSNPSYCRQGGFGREFASYDDGASWHEIGPAHERPSSVRHAAWVNAAGGTIRGLKRKKRLFYLAGRVHFQIPQRLCFSLAIFFPLKSYELSAHHQK